MQSLARATGRAVEHASCLRPRNAALLSRRGSVVAMKAAAAAAGGVPVGTQGTCLTAVPSLPAHSKLAPAGGYLVLIGVCS